MSSGFRRAAVGVSFALAFAAILPASAARAVPTDTARIGQAAPVSAVKVLRSSLHHAAETFRHDVTAARSTYTSKDGGRLVALAAYRHALRASTSADDMKRARDGYIAARGLAVDNYRLAVDGARTRYRVTAESAFADFDGLADPEHATDALTYRSAVRAAFDAARTSAIVTTASFDTCAGASVNAAYAAYFAARAAVNAGTLPHSQLQPATSKLRAALRTDPVIEQCRRDERLALRLIRQQRTGSVDAARAALRAATGHRLAYPESVVDAPGAVGQNFCLECKFDPGE